MVFHLVNNMNKMNNLKFMVTSGVSFFVAYSILTGSAQEVVHFAGPLNEIFCFILAFTMGFISLFGLDWRGFFQWLVK